MTPLRTKVSSNYIELSSLAAAALALFVIPFGRIQQSRQIAQSRKRVANAVIALQSVENLSTLLLRAETAQGGFLLTGSDEYLRPYEISASELSAALSDFRRAAETVGLDARQVDTLAAQTVAKFDEVRTVLKVYHERGRGHALRLVRTDEKLLLMTGASAAARNLKVECTLLFTRESDALARQNRAALWTSAAGIAVVLFVIVWITLRLIRLFSRNGELIAQYADALQQYKLLARRLEAVREEERAHLAREIHDAVGQTLTVIKLDVAIAARNVNAGDGAAVSGKLHQVTRTIDAAIQNVRQFAKELRPPLLDAAGLAAALEVYVAELQASTGLSITLHTDPLPTLDSEQAIAAFRICQEALTNILRHAQATEVSMTVTANGEVVRVTVKDNGMGFRTEPASGKGSLGLLGMRERAALVDGQVEIESQPGKGTVVAFWMPTRELREADL